MNDLVPLADAHCSPKRGQEHRLTEASMRELMPQLPGWERVEDGQLLLLPQDESRAMTRVKALTAYTGITTSF